jgi:RNA polymerase sigma-70 factor (family 1)
MPDISTNTDDQLVILLQAGDADAFTEIYARYWKLLFYIAEKRLNNYTEAEETVQNIFTDLWARRMMINIRTSLKYYLAAAVHYQVIKYFAKRHTSLELSDTDASNNSADQILNFHELEQQIQELVSALPEKCRLVYQLSRDQGLANKIIAQQLGLSEKTVENQLTKALSRIRSGLGGGSVRLLLMCLLSATKIFFPGA